jgi:hypothetical protein
MCHGDRQQMQIIREFCVFIRFIAVESSDALIHMCHISKVHWHCTREIRRTLNVLFATFLLPLITIQGGLFRQGELLQRFCTDQSTFQIIQSPSNEVNNRYTLFIIIRKLRAKTSIKGRLNSNFDDLSKYVDEMMAN